MGLTGDNGQNRQTREAKRGQICVFNKKWGSHLEGNWGGERRLQRRGQREEEEEEENRSSNLFFNFPFLFLSSFSHHPSPHSTFPYRALGAEVPRPSQELYKENWFLNNNLLLHYKLKFLLERVIFPPVWPHVRLRTIKQPHSGGRGKGQGSCTPCFKRHSPGTLTRPSVLQLNLSHESGLCCHCSLEFPVSEDGVQCTG